MKKFLFILINLCSILFCANAQQVCKISNSNDNVEVFSAELSEDNTFVTVIVSNDSKDISANITIKVEVTYTNGSGKKTLEFSGKGLALPQQNSTMKIKINPTYPNNAYYKPNSVQVKEITGTKCIE